MKKKGLLVVMGLLFCGALFFLYQTFQIINKKRERMEHITQLPKVSFLTIDERTIYLDNTQNFTVLLHFNSQCDVCIEELKQIIEAIDEFKQTEIIMASSESLDSIRNLYNNLDLKKYSNISMVKANNSLYESFGTLSIPHIFIYRQGKLISEFRGKTDINLVLNSLKN
jgi:peroxiredoxin